MITRKILVAQLVRLNKKFANLQLSGKWITAAIGPDGIYDCAHDYTRQGEVIKLVTINCHWHDRVPMMLEDDVCKAVGIPE